MDPERDGPLVFRRQSCSGAGFKLAIYEVIKVLFRHVNSSISNHQRQR